MWFFIGPNFIRSSSDRRLRHPDEIRNRISSQIIPCLNPQRLMKIYPTSSGRSMLAFYSLYLRSLYQPLSIPLSCLAVHSVSVLRCIHLLLVHWSCRLALSIFFYFFPHVSWILHIIRYLLALAYPFSASWKALASTLFFLGYHCWISQGKSFKMYIKSLISPK